MTIQLTMRGQLRLTEQLRALTLNARDRRMLHIRMADAVARAMKRAVRERVEASPLGLFEDNPLLRRRKARSFARMIGRRATPLEGIVFDRGIGHSFRQAKAGGGATDEQATRLKDLGFGLSKRKIMRDFSRGLAGLIIHRLEEQQGRQRRRRGGSKNGSLLLLVWREQGKEIVASVNLQGIIRGFLAERLRRAA